MVQRFTALALAASASLFLAPWASALELSQIAGDWAVDRESFKEAFNASPEVAKMPAEQKAMMMGMMDKMPMPSFTFAKTGMTMKDPQGKETTVAASAFTSTGPMTGTMKAPDPKPGGKEHTMKMTLVGDRIELTPADGEPSKAGPQKMVLMRAAKTAAKP